MLLLLWLPLCCVGIPLALREISDDRIGDALLWFALTPLLGLAGFVLGSLNPDLFIPLVILWISVTSVIVWKWGRQSGVWVFLRNLLTKE
jgi:hypothetical protein